MQHGPNRSLQEKRAVTRTRATTSVGSAPPLRSATSTPMRCRCTRSGARCALLVLACAAVIGHFPPQNRLKPEQPAAPRLHKEAAPPGPPGSQSSPSVSVAPSLVGSPPASAPDADKYRNLAFQITHLVSQRKKEDAFFRGIYVMGERVTNKGVDKIMMEVFFVPMLSCAYLPYSLCSGPKCALGAGTSSRAPVNSMRKVPQGPLWSSWSACPVPLLATAPVSTQLNGGHGSSPPLGPIVTWKSSGPVGVSCLMMVRMQSCSWRWMTSRRDV